jgi:Tfp pilus assembly protein PilF
VYHPSFKRNVLLVVVTCTLGCQSGPKPETSQHAPMAFLQQTQAKVEEALRIEPKVEKPHDPTSLEYDAGPIKPNLHLSAAAVMEQNGQLDAAREHYRKVLAMEPANRAALIGVARLHHRANALNEAIAAYQHALKIVGNDPVILNDLALCLTRATRHAEAIETLKAALALTPDSLLYRNNLAAVLVESHRAEEAVQVLAETQGLAVAHYNVGYLLNRHGEPAAASAHFVQSLRADPSFQPARTMLDRVLPEVGRHSEQRVAEGPPPSASAANVSVPPGTAGASPPPLQPGVLAPQAVAAPANVLTNLPLPEVVQRAQFASPLDAAPVAAPSTAAPAVQMAQLPPIRFPAPAARRVSHGPGGFIAPAPTAH